MPPASPHILLTVTNDLTYDQRMQRIATSLATAGYKVILIGRELAGSLPLENQAFEQARITCRYNSGKLFYLEYNWRLFKWLAQKVEQLKKTNNPVAVCAIDLDTILPCLRVSKKFNLPRVYDAHELFTELTEVKRRPLIYKAWHWVEQNMVPQFEHGYTVNQFIADELKRRYGVNYEVIRNLPRYRGERWQMTYDRQQTKYDETRFTIDRSPLTGSTDDEPTRNDIDPNSLIPSSPFFLYQGAVNEGRSFETLIPAMKSVNAPLLIAGDGNFYAQAKEIAAKNGLGQKVFFTGYLTPVQLQQLTPTAYAGITIFENTGLNQYYSLANRYFDYINAGIPQLCVNYPEYAALNATFETALLTDDLSSEALAKALNNLLDDAVLYNRLKGNCSQAAEELCWEKEEMKLIALWKNILPLQSGGNH